MRTFWLGIFVVCLVGLTAGCWTTTRREAAPAPKTKSAPKAKSNNEGAKVKTQKNKKGNRR